MRLRAAVLFAALTACSTSVEPTNPYDPATPLERQAKARVRGLIAAPTLPSASGLPLSLASGGQVAREERTGSTGSFVFDALTPGSYTLSCAPTGFVAFSLALQLKQGEELDLGTLQLTPLSGSDASALLGRVTLENQADHGGTLVEAVGRGFTAVTDSAGNFRLQVVEGTYDLRVSRPGYIGQELLAVTVARGAERVLDAMTLLGNPARLSGHVDGERPDGAREVLANAAVTLEGTAISGFTNALGDFTLTGIPPGSYLVRVIKAGYGAGSAAVLGVEGGQVRSLGEAIYLPLARGRITGRVALAGTGDASGAVVELTGSGRAVVTGADGLFAFEALAGPWGLSARRDGYSPATLPLVTVAEGQTLDVGTLSLGRSGGAVAIQEAPFTRFRLVTLLLDSPGALRFKRSEDPTFTDAALGDVAGSPWRDYVQGQPEPFTLADQDGERTVTVLFQGSGGTGAPVSARVVLDRQAPQSPALVIGAGGAATNAPGGIVSLSLSAIDAAPSPGVAVSGLARMELSNRADFAVKQVVDYARTWTWTLDDPATQGAKQVFARFLDGAGNVSAAASANVLFDTVAPDSPSISLVGGDAGTPGFTRTPVVAVNASVHDAFGGAGNQDLFLRLSNSDGFVGALWQPFSPATTWFLSPGDGAKVVWAEFLDAAGNVSGRVSAAITLDSAGPTSPALSIQEQDSRPANGFTNVATVRLTLGAAGATRAVVAENQALTGGQVYDLATMPVDYLLGSSGAHTLWVRFSDAAGNLSELATASVTLDQVPPLARPPVLAPAPFSGGYAVALTPPSAGQDELLLTGGLTAPAGWTAAPAGVAIPVTLSAGAGLKTLALTYRDAADNVTSAGSLTVTVDVSAPALPAVVVRGALADGTSNTSTTVTRSVTLDLSGAADAGAGVAEMMLSESSLFAGASWQPFAASPPFTLSAGDGPKAVWVKLRDAVGNAMATGTSGAITLDTSGPTSPGVAVLETDTRPSNGFTNSRAYRVVLNAAGTPVRAEVAESPSFAAATSVDLAGQTLPYTTAAGLLTLLDADGAHTVWVRYFDAAGNASAAVPASVVLDRQPPGATPPTLSPSGFTGSTTVTLTAVPAGQDELQVGGAGVSPAVGWTAAPAGTVIPVTLAAGDGAKAITVTYRDAADNQATATALSVTLDTAPPTAAPFAVTGRLADGVASTTLTATTSVTLDLSAPADGAGSGVAEVMLSNDAAFAGAAWQPFVRSSAVPWTLAPGDAATKPVYAKFRDGVGRISATASGSIELLETPPSGGSVVIEGGAPSTAKQVVNLKISASGAAQMCIAVDGLGCSWVAYATAATADLGLLDQAGKVVTVSFRNRARGEGGGASSAIWYDRVAPPAGTLALTGTLGNGATSSGWATSLSIVARPAGASADSASMAFAPAANPAACAAALAAPSWQPWAPTATLLLPAGDGPKTICVVYRDDTGNWLAANAASATITLDTTAPSNPSFTDLVSGVTNRASVTGSVTAKGAADTYQCFGGAYGAAWSDCSGASPFTFLLVPNAENTLGIRLRDAAFNASAGSLVRVLQDGVAPLPPRLRVVRTTATSIHLEWDPSASADVAGYRVQYGTAPGDLSGSGAAQGPSPVEAGQTNAFELTGMITGVNYYLSVVALDAAGNASAPSNEQLAVPNTVNPRLLATWGADLVSMAVRRDGTTTRAYVGARQGLLQLDLTTPSAPVLTGRIALPGVVPIPGKEMPVAACTVGGVAGHCVFVAGNSLEAEFRPNPTLFRTGVTVVFFALTGTPAAPVAGRVIATIGARAEQILVTADGRHLLVLDARQLAAFDILDPATPVPVGTPAPLRTLAGAAVVTSRLHGAGIVGGALYALYTPPGGAPIMQSFDLAAPAASFATSTVDMKTDAGASLSTTDTNGVTIDPLPVFAGGIYVSYNVLTTTAPASIRIRIGRYAPGGGLPLYTGDAYANGSYSTNIRWSQWSVAGQGRFFFFAPDELKIALDVYTVKDSGSAITFPIAASRYSGQQFTTMQAAATFPSGADDQLFLLTGLSRSAIYQAVATATVVPNPPTLAYDEPAPTGLAQFDRFLFVASHNGLSVVDASNPILPRRVGTLAGNYLAVAAVGQRIWVTASSGSTSWYQVDFDGVLSAAQGTIGVPPLAITGKYLYAISGGGLSAYGVDNLTTPVATNAAWSPAALAVRGPYLYAAFANGTFQVLQHAGATISAVSPAPLTLPLTSRSNLRVTVAGSGAIVTDNLGAVAIDLGTPSSPQTMPVGSSPTRLALSGPASLHGGYAVAFDVSPPESGIRFQAINGEMDGTQPFARCGPLSQGGIHGSALVPPGLAHDAGVFYVSCLSSGLQVISAVNPSGGRIVHDELLYPAKAALAVDGLTAYVGSAAYGQGATNSLWQVDYGGLAAGQAPTTSYDQATDAGSVPVAMNMANGLLVASVNGVTVGGVANVPVVRFYDVNQRFTPWPQLSQVAIGNTGGRSITGQPVTYGDYLFLIRDDVTGKSLVSVDIRDPAAPWVYWTASPFTSAQAIGGLALYRNRLFVPSWDATAKTATVRVWNVRPGAESEINPVGVQALVPTINGVRDAGAAGGYLFLTYSSSSWATPFGLAVIKLSASGDGLGVGAASLVGTWESPLPLGQPIVTGDLLFVRANQGLALFDMTPLWSRGEMPVFLGTRATAEAQATRDVKLIIDGPWAHLLGDSYRVLDLR